MPIEKMIGKEVFENLGAGDKYRGKKWEKQSSLLLKMNLDDKQHKGSVHWGAPALTKQLPQSQLLSPRLMFPCSGHTAFPMTP